MATITHLTADVCADLADQGNDVIARLRALGVRVPHRHGLRTALERLRAIAGSALAADAAGWARSAAAVQLVTAWVDVIRVIPPAITPALREELAGALRGTSADDPSTDVLSQLALGGLLLDAGGVEVSVPSGDGARPDFLLNFGGHVAGVEVKRPRTPTSARACIREGAGQLRTAGAPGLIALDLGLALDAHTLTHASYTRGAAEPRAGDVIGPRFMALSEQLARHIDAQQSKERAERAVAPAPRSPRFGAVHGVLCYARVFE